MNQLVWIKLKSKIYLKVSSTSVALSRVKCMRAKNAGMAELADAHGSGPCESNFMQVQVLLPAPKCGTALSGGATHQIQSLFKDLNLKKVNGVNKTVQ